MINQHVQVKRYYKFCIRFNFNDIHPSPSQLALYIEYLSENLKSYQSVRNYLSAVSFIHRELGLECESMRSHQVTTMLKAVDHTLRSTVVQRQPVSIHLLAKLVQLCDQLGHWGLIVKCAILFCFFGFLRQSNVAPRSANLFDPTRHTLRADVHTSLHGLALQLKWTKTQQGSHHPIVIPLPLIQGSPLCPTRAYKHMCTVFPASGTSTPLLIYRPKGGSNQVVTTRMLAKQFLQFTKRLQLPPATFSLHSLRKGGATYCHSLGIPIDQIKSHGTWASDAVWTYLNPDLAHKSVISNTMSQAVKTTTLDM